MRITTRHLMIAVVVAAYVMVVVRTWGLTLVWRGMVGGFMLTGMGWWELRKRGFRSAWSFATLGVLINLAVVTDCLYFSNPSGRWTLSACVAMIGIPITLAFGGLWADARTGTAQEGPRRWPRIRAWIVVLAVSFVPMTMMTATWPARLAFLASRPALDRLADRIEAGEVVGKSEWAGCYRVVDAGVAPNGNVALMLDDGCGFIRPRPGSADRSGPFNVIISDEPFDQRWRYQVGYRGGAGPVSALPRPASGPNP